MSSTSSTEAELSEYGNTGNSRGSGSFLKFESTVTPSSGISPVPFFLPAVTNGVVQQNEEENREKGEQQETNGLNGKDREGEEEPTYEENPLALLTPNVKRRSIPVAQTTTSPKRVLTSQDSKAALFGNLFGPVGAVPSPPTNGNPPFQTESDSVANIQNTMQIFNLKTSQDT